MKNKLWIVFASIALLAVAMATMSNFTNAGTEYDKLMSSESAGLAGSTANYYLYPTSATGYTSGTVTNAENDTLTLGSNLVSRWSYNWHINSTQASGTENIIAILQETNNASASYSTPTDWIEVDRDTLTANEDLRMTGDVVYGIKQRLILDGSGTQSTTYTVKFAAKKF